MIVLISFIFGVVLAQPRLGIGLNEDMNIHPPFTAPDDLWELSPELREEDQVIKLTGELYDKLVTMRIFGFQRNVVPWVVLFVNTQHIDSKRAMNQYRYLARAYNGTVRFGWIDRGQDELLAESFGARELPSTFFIKDGVAYHYRDFTYANKLAQYIER